MKIVVTGSSNGIGKAIAEKFIDCGHEVIGIDTQNAAIVSPSYTHFAADVYSDELPHISGVQILVNNAGVQNSGRDTDVNLKGAIRVTENYAFQSSIKSVLFIASASARSGSEFPEYVASKGGMVSYMKNVALRIAEYGATANSLSPGGVITDLNKHILTDENLWKQVMNETPLKKWATTDEIAEFAYFVTVVNKSMTAEDLLIDNGEYMKAKFIW